ncbi:MULTISPECIES: histidine kinase [unclassified Micromonospora]|uniref:sensor histidine kinase n=1 Tax=unclassified Micromonospora TaxID=2617518 RepID=UPI003317B0BC
MTLLRTWSLPSALVGAQLLIWPGLPLLSGDAPGVAATSAGLVAAVVTLLALGWRQRRPLPVLGVVLAAQTLGRLGASPDDLLVLSLAELVAIWSVAVRAPGRVVRVALAASTLWVASVNLPRFDTAAAYLGEVVVAVLGYLLAAGLGRSRRHWVTGRAAVAGRLVAVEAEARQAAETERHRLARELHDVSAHHLTSIVVTVGAAERLAARRPELAAEAVEFAARTGRETLVALRRLVVVMGDDTDVHRPLRRRLDDLVAGFHRLGQPVRLDRAGPEPPAALADVVHAVVRESLTNVVRHAAGADVSVRVAVDGGTVTVTVADTGVPGPTATFTLGAGRGISGLRERVAALGGTLRAGPDGDGWRVEARLPVGTDPGNPPSPVRSANGRSLVTAALVGNALVLPVAAALVSVETDVTLAGLRDPIVLLQLLLLSVAHAAPLAWRCGRPWAAFAGVAGTVLLWPVTALLVGLPRGAEFVLLTAGLADLAAVWAVAAYARRAGPTWLAAPVAATVLAVGLVGTAAADGSIAGEPVHVPVTVFMTVFVAGLLLAPMVLTWGGGALVRGRRRRVLSREDDALAAAAARAVAAARAERERVGAGLRSAVLDRAGRLVVVADQGRLAEILVEARATLAAMRGLLDDLRADERPTPHGPQPTLADVGGLCASRQAGGRDVLLDAPATVPALPTDVDVSAYRLVEAALDAGAGPARVVLRLVGGELRVSVTGLPTAADPLVVAGLRARVDALGGRLALRRGELRARLPLPSVPVAPAARPGQRRERVPEGAR